MTPIVNLHILVERYTQLSKSAYFDPAFRDFASRTVEAIVHVIENAADYPDEVVRQFQEHAWHVMQFLKGSRSNDAPHEAQYVLSKALKEWINADALISSASLEHFGFFLNPADLWSHIARALDKFDTKGYSPLLVRIGAPEAFKHRPIFCIPLFHELGHFVDHHYKISELSLLFAQPGPPPANMHPAIWREANLNHRMEHFADLFSACYTSEGSKKSLLAIAPNHGASHTHPATTKRVEVIEHFLGGHQDPMVNLFQATLAARGLPSLSPRFKLPDLAVPFDDVLPCRFSEDAELYGVFSGGWDYLYDQIATRAAPWIDDGVDVHGIERTVNDLVEKSIRNFEIRERWNSVAAN